MKIVKLLMAEKEEMVHGKIIEIFTPWINFLFENDLHMIYNLI